MALQQGRIPLCLFVDYGHQETHHWHKKFNIYVEVKVTGLFYRFDMKYQNVAFDYIPNRNMILVAIAGAIAEQEGIREIWYGANLSDVANRYPDCTPAWVEIMNSVLPESVKLIAPLHEMTQEEVIAKLDGDAD